MVLSRTAIQCIYLISPHSVFLNLLHHRVSMLDHFTLQPGVAAELGESVDMIKWQFLIRHIFALKFRDCQLLWLLLLSTAVKQCERQQFISSIIKGIMTSTSSLNPICLTEMVGFRLLCDFFHFLLLLYRINYLQLSFLSASSQHVISIKTSVTFKECQVMKISEQDIMPETWGISVASSSNCDDFLKCRLV